MFILLIKYDKSQTTRRIEIYDQGNTKIMQ